MLEDRKLELRMTGVWAVTDEAWEGDVGTGKSRSQASLVMPPMEGSGMGCLLSRDWCPSSSPIRKAMWRGALRNEGRGKTRALARQARVRGTWEKKDGEAGRAPALDIRNHNHSNYESTCFQMLAATLFSASCCLLAHSGVLLSLNADTLPFRSLGLIMILGRKRI